MTSHLIYDFDKFTSIQEWKIINDDVMGGRSSANFRLNDEGHGVFEGNVSLENNGGFSSVRYRFDKLSIKNYNKIILNLKGDGAKYQFRIKIKDTDTHSYISSFSSSGEWQKIEISLKDMPPYFKGKKLNQPNFNESNIEQVAFLIGNKKEQPFKLIINYIQLK